MTKAELLDRVLIAAKDADVNKKQVTAVVDGLFTVLKKGIKKDHRFIYPGFGTWTMKKRKARKGRNPQTGEDIKIKASKTVTFKPAPVFKDML
jgi:DNA-binding protein HU-beta